MFPVWSLQIRDGRWEIVLTVAILSCVLYPVHDAHDILHKYILKITKPRFFWVFRNVLYSSLRVCGKVQRISPYITCSCRSMKRYECHLTLPARSCHSMNRYQCHYTLPVLVTQWKTLRMSSYITGSCHTIKRF